MPACPKTCTYNAAPWVSTSWRAAALTCMRCNEGPRVLLPARVATLLRDGTCYLLIHSPMLPAWPHLQTKSTVDSKFGDSGFEMPIPLP